MAFFPNLALQGFLAFAFFTNSETLENPKQSEFLPYIHVERPESLRIPISIYNESQPYEQLPWFPLWFIGEKTIFLNSEDFEHSRLDVSIRLTCAAPYVTKWVFNSHFQDEAERGNRMLPFNYSFKAFPRPNESPFSNHRSEDHELYNLTELTVHSIGESLKSASMDCVSVLNESIKSSINIFQRFEDPQRSFDFVESWQIADSTFVVPCRVNDPDVMPGIRRIFDSDILNSAAVKYNWKSGFRRVSDESFPPDFTFQCVYGSPVSRVYQQYKFEQDIDDITGLNTFIIEVSLRNYQVNGPFGINSVQISKCTSPYYCVLNSTTEVRCVNVQICYAILPSHTEGQEVNKIITEGKVVTFGNINGELNPKTLVSDVYFPGLSGKVYLLSQSVPPKELIQVNIELSRDSKKLNISCSALKFLTSDPIKFSKTKKNGTKSILNDDSDLDSWWTDYRITDEVVVDESDSVRRKSLSVEVIDVCDVAAFSCHVLWFNSTQWMEETVYLNEPGIFQSAVRDKCTVTGPPITKHTFRPPNLTGIKPYIGLYGTVVPMGSGTLGCHSLWFNSTQWMGDTIYFDEEDLLDLAQCPPQEKIAHLDIRLYEGASKARILCKAIKCLTEPNIQIAIRYIDGTQMDLTSDDSDTSIVKQIGSHVFINDQTQEKLVDLSVVNGKEIEAVTCQIPWYNSTQRIHATLNFTSSTEESYQTLPVFQLCNDTVYDVTAANRYFYSSKWEGHSNELFLIYYDSQVSLYSDKYLSSSIIENIKVVSDAWRYAKTTYDFLDSDLTLNVITTDHKREACKTSRMKSYDDQTNKNLVVIECGSLIGDLSLASFTYTIVNQIGNLTLRMAQAPGSWPALKISGWEMADILAYDILLGLGKSQKAKEWKEFKMNDTTGNPKENTFWFRNWYFPIYSNYGQSMVLNKYMKLLRKHWQKRAKEYDYNEHLKLEEFVHFWSGAAGVNLKSVANNTFHWNDENDKRLGHAQDNYPEIAYDGSSQSTKPGTDALMIGVSCGFVSLVLVLVITFVTIHRSKIHLLKKQFRELTKEELQSFFDGNLNGDSSKPGYTFIECQPFNKEYEIARDRLNISHDQVLGSGEFGVVFRGHIKGRPEDQNAEDTLVAVKTVKPNVDVSYFMALLTELKVMAYVGTHANIACLLGACTTNIRNREVFVALEFCAKGDLLGYLKKHREIFVDLLENQNKHYRAVQKGPAVPKKIYSQTTSFATAESLPSALIKAESISTMDLVIWSQQIALGMDFVGLKNVIHGDLAARNVLLTTDNVAKISDFGLSRQLHNYSTYVKTSKTPLPWKWMAIESLRDMTFSIHSDVWAFGVTLFEIFSLGTLPYPGRTWTLEFVDELVDGLRLNSPKHGNKDVYNLMLDCMKLEPTERIRFAEIAARLEEIKPTILSRGANAGYILV